MSGVQDQLDIKFRLTDGTDIGPKTFPAATSVSTLKESILAQWPKEKDNGPRTVKDVKIISAGRILENNRTVGECRSPLCDIPGVVTTMHVVVQTPSSDRGTGGGEWMAAIREWVCLKHWRGAIRTPNPTLIPAHFLFIDRDVLSLFLLNKIIL